VCKSTASCVLINVNYVIREEEMKRIIRSRDRSTNWSPWLLVVLAIFIAAMLTLGPEAVFKSLTFTQD
jgi:hypothetical protein